MESVEGGEESESENITFNENEKLTTALNMQRGSNNNNNREPTTSLNTQRGSNNNNNMEPTTSVHMQNIKNAPSSSLPGIEEEEVDRR